MITYNKKYCQTIYSIRYILYNYYGDTMELFKSKKKINRNAMKNLIEQSIDNLLAPMEKVIKDLNIQNHDLTIINVFTINCELCRYELYKNNDKEEVDYICNKIYEEYFNNKGLSNEQINTIRSIIYVTKLKCDEIFSSKRLLAPLDRFCYRLLLEQLNIREDTIESGFLSELKYCSSTWYNNATGINGAYSIDNSLEEKQKNESIDIRF